MAIKTYPPITPARRYYSVGHRGVLTVTEPHKTLLEPIRKTGGRNNLGRICTKYRGGGERRHYRIIDFERCKRDVPGRVKTIEYDPNRTSRIALVAYADGVYRYILAPEGLQVGDVVMAGRSLPIRTGNAMPLSDIPVGVEIHNLQLYP
ncbi:MAG: 50S ribosomal protein L2, partial [candidate division WOR-3 bacterium]